MDKTEYERLGGPAVDEEEQDYARAKEEIGRLEKYQYFDGAKILASAHISQTDMLKGKNMMLAHHIVLTAISTGYLQSDGSVCGRADFEGKEGRKEFPVGLVFSRDKLVRAVCQCPKCSRMYSWHAVYSSEHVAAALLLLEEYLKEHTIADATDQEGISLLQMFRMRRSNQIKSETAKTERLNLAPRLVKKDGTLSLSCRVGAGKLFVVKDLGEFCYNIRESRTTTYGTSTEINHSLENFTEDSRGWIDFLNQVVREEEEFAQRLEDSRYYFGRRRLSLGSSLPLFGWRLDRLYELMGTASIEYEDRDVVEKKKKGTLTCGIGNPVINLRISEIRKKKDQEFHGIQVNGELPELFRGIKAAYYVDGEKLYRTEEGFMQALEPLWRLSEYNRVSFQIGRNKMAEFYYRILPELQKVAVVHETYPLRFRSYLPPEGRYVFYLDAEEDKLLCRPVVRYGDTEVSALDGRLERYMGVKREDAFRDWPGEEETVGRVENFFPELDAGKKELSCQGDEAAYKVVEEGVDQLLSLGEVLCTKRFRDYRIIRRVKMSVGVSVSSGLLDLEIGTEELSQEELLDVLRAYKAKKKYFRLKDGAFVDMQDPSLGTLSEMMEAMRLSPKEFVKGKMHIPAYRTLYLDKMLEENDEIYSRRDSHFREMVKEFKTISDAEFEEPESLSNVMRKYQKNGYKWLRTLEQWKFGGILADEMGLGKTLQMIAVLLAAKQDGKQGTSIIVTPASLVFNWGEEFRRFAPDLTVGLVAGGQEERREKIGQWQDYDVLVTSYDLLKRDIAYYEGKEFLYQVIDEAQYIKNHTTAAAKAVKTVKSQIRFALTGTPIENRLSELWSIFDYLMPGFLYGYDTFRKEFETPIVKNGDEDAMKRLQRMTGPFILRRLKTDVLRDLPEKLEENRYVRMDSEQRKLYDAQVANMKEILAQQSDEDFNKNRLQVLREITRLRQICCDPSLCFENYQGESAKVEACMDLVESAIDGGHRMLLFSQFTSMLDILKGELEKRKISYCEITGSTPKEKRLEQAKEFNEGETPVFLISLKAGGVGLNLTGADMVIHYDPWWNLAAQNQATDRAHRIGQQRAVSVFKLIAQGTLEEKIVEMQARKHDLAEAVLGGEALSSARLTQEDVLALLGV